MPGQRIRKLIRQLGFDGGKTLVGDYLREVRPLLERPRTFQRTVYRCTEPSRLFFSNRRFLEGLVEPRKRGVLSLSRSRLAGRIPTR